MARAKNEAPKNLVAVPGRLVFADLLKPGAAPQYPDNLRYGVTLQVSKDSSGMDDLWKAIAAAAKKTWGSEAQSRLDAIQSAIDNGIDPSSSPISIDDGDLFNPEYNAGFFIVKARRRADKGAPVLLALDGSGAEDPADVPQPGDGVIAMINPWCQADRKRMNLTLVAVRRAVIGAPIGGGLSADEVEAGVGALSQLSLPMDIPGVQALPSGSGSGNGRATTKPRAKAIASSVEAEVVEDEDAPPARPPKAGARRSRLMDLE